MTHDLQQKSVDGKEDISNRQRDSQSETY